MHLKLPQHILIESDWTLLGNVIRENENVDDLRKVTLAALIHSGRELWDLPVFWTAPLQTGMLDSEHDEVLFFHLVDFGRTMDFTKMDFRNAHTLFPTLAYFSPNREEVREARVIAHLLSRQRQHWRASKIARNAEQQASGVELSDRLIAEVSRN